MSQDLYSEQETKITELENENRWYRAALKMLRDDMKNICCFLAGCQHPACHSTARAWAKLRVFRD